MAYSEVFKQKYQKEYNSTLRSMTGHPSESAKYITFDRTELRKIENWQ